MIEPRLKLHVFKLCDDGEKRKDLIVKGLIVFGC